MVVAFFLFRVLHLWPADVVVVPVVVVSKPTAFLFVSFLFTDVLYAGR